MSKSESFRRKKEVKIMKPMIWHPEEKDAKINEYFQAVNHAPYITIWAWALILFCGVASIIVIGGF